MNRIPFLFFTIALIALLVTGMSFSVASTPGDLNADGKVDVQDLGILLSNWSSGDTACPEPCRGDINGDGIVNVLDLGILLSHWGQGATQLPSEPQRPIPFSVQSQTATHAHIGVSWGAASNAAEYIYTSGLNGGSGWSGQNGTTQSTSVTLSSVPNGSDIWFCVKARNSAGESASVCNSFIVPGGTSPPPPPPPPPSSGGGGPNEPGGYIKITERSFSATKEDGWTVSFGGEDPNSGNFRIQTDSSALISPPNIGAARFPQGMTGGVAPINLFRAFDEGKKELYLRYGFQISENFVNHPVGSKIHRVQGLTGGSLTLNHPFDGIDGSDMIFKVQLPVQQEGSRLLNPNLANSKITPGRWYDIELVYKMNSAHGVADGQVHVWINGVKTHEYTSVEISTGDSALRWSRMRWNPTYGGVGSEVPHDQWMRISHLYVSGR